jgi:hypothetical protein
MVLFGQNPSQGTLLKASQFLSEELPIRLSHRVSELDTLPDGLDKMPSIVKVKEWYAQSFEVSTRDGILLTTAGTSHFPTTAVEARARRNLAHSG